MGVQSAGDLVSETSQLIILHSAEEDNLSPFDSKIGCLCQSFKTDNSKHVYRPNQVKSQSAIKLSGLNTHALWGRAVEFKSLLDFSIAQSMVSLHLANSPNEWHLIFADGISTLIL